MEFNAHGREYKIVTRDGGECGTATTYLEVNLKPHWASIIHIAPETKQAILDAIEYGKQRGKEEVRKAMGVSE